MVIGPYRIYKIVGVDDHIDPLPIIKQKQIRLSKKVSKVYYRNFLGKHLCIFLCKVFLMCHPERQNDTREVCEILKDIAFQ